VPVFDLVGETYPLASQGISTQKTMNFVVEMYPGVSSGEPGTKVPKILKCLAGMRKVLDGGDRRCRGLYVSSTGPAQRSYLYGVFGEEVRRYNLSVTAYWVIGRITDSNNPVSMVDNGFHLVIAAGGSLYSADLMALEGQQTLSGISLPVAPGNLLPMAPTCVAFCKQRLIINTGTNNQWAFSNSASTVFEADSFYSAESLPDPINSLKVCDGSIWVFGPRSYEIWRVQDDQDSPFTSVGGNSGAIGCSAQFTPSVIDNQVYWLGGSDVGAMGVYMGTGLSATRISNPGVEYMIGNMSSRGDTIGYCYADNGNSYFVMTFISGDYSLGYTPVGGWHERSTRDLLTADDHAHSCLFPVQYGDKIYSGCFYDGGLYEFDETYAKDWDTRTYRRQRISKVMTATAADLILKRIYLDMDVGTTASTTLAPQMQLEISLDGGKTYGPVYTKSLGTQGQYKKRVEWFKGASARNIVLRLTYEDGDVIANIFQAFVDYDVCVA